MTSPTAQKLNILVLHGLVQTAQTVSRNTTPLRIALQDVADLHYVEGPENPGTSARPWWYRGTDRWELSLQYWSEILSKRQYDGIIGLSQGSAMAAVLCTMLRCPEKYPGFTPALEQPIKFGIFCSGFISDYEDRISKHFVQIPESLPTLHTVDNNDMIVSAASTKKLALSCKKYILLEHNEGHSIPVGGDFPQIMKDFILNSISVNH